MTPEVRNEFVRLWADNVPIPEIAKRICYSESYVRMYAAQNRDILPRRYVKKTPIEVRRECVAKIKAGTETSASVAKRLGLNRRTVSNWLSRKENQS